MVFGINKYFNYYKNREAATEVSLYYFLWPLTFWFGLSPHDGKIPTRIKSNPGAKRPILRFLLQSSVWKNTIL